MPRPRSRDLPLSRKSTAPHAVALGILLLAPFAPLLVFPGGRVLGNPRCDNPGMFYFLNDFAGQSWRAGEVPLWNPHIMLGMPFLGEGQASVFHPLSLLFIVFPTGAAINGLVALSFLAGGLFFWGYLRAVGLGRRASFCGALVWAFSSPAISMAHSGRLPHLLCLMTLPALLLFWERSRRAPSIPSLAGFSLAYASLILAGYPPLTYAFSLFLLLYAGSQAILALRQGRGAAARELRAVVLLGVFVLLGIGIGMIQLLPTADFASECFRRRSSIEFCGRFSLSPENLLTLLCPYFFGVTNEAGPDLYWGRNYLWDNWLYVGALPLVAAAAGVAAAPAKRRLPLLVCAGFFLVVALGKHTPLFPLLYRYAPFFDVFRGPSKYILVTHFCVVVLAAYGLDWRLKPPRQGASCPPDKSAVIPRRWALACAAVLLLAVVLVAIVLLPGRGLSGSRLQSLLKWRYRLGDVYLPPLDPGEGAVLEETGGRAARQLARAGVLLLASSLVFLSAARRKIGARTVFCAVLVLLAADLGTFFKAYWRTFDESITRYPDSFIEALSRKPYPARLSDSTSHRNAAMGHGLSSIGGYVGATLPRFNHFVNATQGYPMDTSQAAAQFQSLPARYRFLALEYVVLPSDWPDPGLEVVARGESRTLYIYPGGFPRAFLAAAPRALPTSQAALEYVVSSDADLFEEPAVENLEAALDPAPLHPEERIRLASFRRNRVELEVEATRRRLLILNEMFYKDWRARVNGRPAKIHPANYLFRGVVVPAGQSTVVFEYRPVSFWIGLLISAISLLCLAVVSAVLASRRGDAKRAGVEETESTEPVPGPSRS